MSTLNQIGPKIKGFFRSLSDDVVYLLILVLCVAASFGLGRLSVLVERGGVEIMPPKAGIGDAVLLDVKTAESAPIQAVENLGGKVVGSKNGTKYHLPWCSGAKRITEANKVWFDSAQEAENAGYTPAANCPGI